MKSRLNRIVIALLAIFGLMVMPVMGIPAATPVYATTGAIATAIAAGDVHACALLSDGTVKCWGWNYAGALGDNTTTDRHTPVDVHTSSSNSSPLSGVTAIAAGGTHTCALMSDGTVKCWGSNYTGQLGDNTTTDSHTPVDVHTSSSNSTPLADVIAIEAGVNYSCALINGGTVKCWGGNSSGQLGDGTTTYRLAPVDVHTSSSDTSPLSGITTIAAHGGYHTCAITSSGGAKCWGEQMGTGSTSSSTPVGVSGLSSGVAFISTGPYISYAVTSSGNLLGWGWISSTPVYIHDSSGNNLSGVAKATTGNSFTCALMTDTKVMCWGNNYNGFLGDGTTTDRSTPDYVHASSATSTPLSGATAISAGDLMCALRANGGVKCWGHNNSGQLGDGTTTDRHTPVDVDGLTGDTTNPTGEITSPKAGDTFGQATVNFDATAADDSGGLGVKEVRFYAEYDGSRHSAGTDTTATTIGSDDHYSLAWATPKTLSTQTITFSIDVEDNGGNVAANADVEVAHFVATALNPDIHSDWVPAGAYVNQLALDSTYGDSMCQGASATMLLGLTGYITPTFSGMEDKARAIYYATEPYGFPADRVAAQINGYNGVAAACVGPDCPSNYGGTIAGAWQVITDTIDNGNPLVAGTRLTTPGHYIVIVGYNDSGSTHQIIAYDPYGDKSSGSYDVNGTTSGSAKGRWVYYDFTTTLFNPGYPNFFVKEDSGS